jgi:divalent metal cation (Fe/Co/Zn/Cd) transporter
VFASIAVGASIIASIYGYPLFDPIFGVVVLLIIIYVGISLVKTSSNFLIGKVIDKDIAVRIENIAESLESIKGVHDISLHDYGVTKL